MFNVRLAGGHLYGKQLFTWLSLVVSLMASFVLSFFPLDVLDEIWDLIESVSEGFLTYSFTHSLTHFRWNKLPFAKGMYTIRLPFDFFFQFLSLKPILVWFKQYFIYQLPHKYIKLQFYVFHDLTVSLELISAIS